MKHYTILFLFLIYITGSFVSCDIHHHHEGAHVHGTARLKIAVEDSGIAYMEFKAPGMNLWGFGHHAESEKDRNQQNEVLNLFRNRSEKIFSFNNQDDCKIIAEEVSVQYGHGSHEIDDHEDEHHDHEGEHSSHSEMYARYRMECSGGVGGHRLNVHANGEFPSLLHMDTVILSDEGQKGVDLAKGAGTLQL